MENYGRRCKYFQNTDGDGLLRVYRQYVFNHSTADEDIKRMRESGKFELAEQCEVVLDNPPNYDGFRPCNTAVYHDLVTSLKHEDLFIM